MQSLRPGRLPRHQQRLHDRQGGPGVRSRCTSHLRHLFLRILAGSKVKVRNSVFQANIGNGIHVYPAGGAGATNSLADIDLGKAGAGNAGNNVLQTVAGSDPNSGAGLCVDLPASAGAQALASVGNQFANRDCTATDPGALKTSTSCAGAVDLGVTQATGTTVTVNTSTCTQP